METELMAVTTEMRIENLDKLARGSEVINTERHRNANIILTCVLAVALVGTVIYYQHRLQVEKKITQL